MYNTDTRYIDTINEIRKNCTKYIDSRNLRNITQFLIGYCEAYKSIGVKINTYTQEKNLFFSYYYKDKRSLNSVSFVEYNESNADDIYKKYWEISDIFYNDLPIEVWVEYVNWIKEELLLSDVVNKYISSYNGTNPYEFYKLLSNQNTNNNDDMHKKSELEKDTFLSTMFEKMEIRPGLYLGSSQNFKLLKYFFRGYKYGAEEIKNCDIVAWVDGLHQFISEIYNCEDFYEKMEEEYTSEQAISKFIQHYNDYMDKYLNAM